jgi:hypothetical protein
LDEVYFEEVFLDKKSAELVFDEYTKDKSSINDCKFSLCSFMNTYEEGEEDDEYEPIIYWSLNEKSFQVERKLLPNEEWICDNIFTVDVENTSEVFFLLWDIKKQGSSVNVTVIQLIIFWKVKLVFMETFIF